MSIINDTKEIIEQIEKIKENLKSDFTNDGLFANMEIRKFSDTTQIERNNRKNPSFHKSYKKGLGKRKLFRVTNLKTAIPYLDIKSILNISLLNKEFNYFIKSIYFYKFVDNIREFKKIQEKKKKLKLKRRMSLSSKNSQISQKTITEQIVGGFYGTLSGTFSLFGNF